MNYRKLIVTGLYVSIALIALLVLFRWYWRPNVQDSTMQHPIVTEEKEEMPKSLAETGSEYPMVTSSPVSASQNGLTEREVAGDIPTQDNKQSSPDIGIAAFRDSIPEGGALLTGGWAMPDGSHMFLLVTPKMRTDLGSDTVEISGEFFGLSPDLLTDPGWNQLLEQNDKNMHLNGAVYDADQLHEFKNLYNAEIRNTVSAPRIITRSGQNASIQIGSATENRILSVVATHNEANGEVDLAVTAAEHD